MCKKKKKCIFGTSKEVTTAVCSKLMKPDCFSVTFLQESEGKMQKKNDSDGLLFIIRARCKDLQNTACFQCLFTYIGVLVHVM